jgi:peptidoglycan/LPS O-acetylase OafA/YrhL
MVNQTVDQKIQASSGSPVPVPGIHLAAPPGGQPAPPHLKVLDGWRGMSILLVLAAHLLPLGPHAWELNYGAGILGMVMFFILSGFLITSILLKEQNLPSFLIRRFFRVIPLAWLYITVALALSGASLYAWFAHYLFFANIPPTEMLPLTVHLWSLCLEMQFYVGVALLVALVRVRGLLLLPILCLLFTGLRVWHGIYASSITYYRIDEILAGCTLALIYHGRLGAGLLRALKSVPQWPVFMLLILSCLPQGGWFNYFRPYMAALLIGATLLNPGTAMVTRLNGRFFLFLAGISYSLYVIHPLLAESWLGSGDVIEKYAKRPLLLAVLFALAYVSTHYYEHRWMGYGRALARFSANRRKASAAL